MSTFQETEDLVLSLLESGRLFDGVVDKDDATDLVRCLAHLSNGGTKEVALATVLEFLDAREHIVLSAAEAGSILAKLLDSALVMRSGRRLSLSPRIVARLQQQGRKLTLSSRDRASWRATVDELMVL
jgi:hypothetical protein